MYEVIPVAAGLIVGFFAAGLDNTRLRAALVAVLSVVIGAIAFTIASEAWFFLPFDVFQAAFGSVVALVAVKRYLPERYGVRDE